MSVIDTFREVFQPKPQSPKLGPADLQAKKMQETFAKQNQQRADSARLAVVEHGLADADRRRHTADRDALVAERKAAGQPLSHSELRVLDAQIELSLAKNAFERHPGSPIVLGDGTHALSKQASRLKTAERNLKSAVDAAGRLAQMVSPAGIASNTVHAFGADARGYTDHKHHMATTMAALKK